jgi:tetratricopeptide (TPR) repeat protein
MRAMTRHEHWKERVAEITEVERLMEAADAEGAVYGPQLLERSPRLWRRLMRHDEHFRSYGTLKYLLAAARERFETEPTTAQQITAAVLAFVDDVQGPSHIHEVALRGLAWKEHANACEILGDLRAALHAAQQSVATYAIAPALLFDETRARLVVSKVLREMGKTAKAIELARECTATFLDFGDLTHANMARMFEAGVLFTLKQFRESLAIFLEVTERAEAERDTLTVARCLHCAAECARELGQLDAARDLYPRALAHFEALDIRDDANRVRWGLALALAAEGKVASAISELFKVRAVFLHLGMNGQAASAALDIVRLRIEAGEDVRDLCSSLVQTFTEAGMAQNAIEALAYLREQASQGTLGASKVIRLKTYFDELTRKPNLAFARPAREEEG